MRYTTLAAALCAGLAVPSEAEDCAPADIAIRQVGDVVYLPSGPASQVQLELHLLTDCELDSLDIVPEFATFLFRSDRDALEGRVLQVGAGSGGPSRYRLSTQSLNDLEAGRVVLVELLQFDRGRFVHAGTYSASLQLEVNGDVAPALIAIMQVEPVVEFLKAAANGSIDVNLGELSDGSYAETEIIYRSNSPMSVSVVSENAGALVQRTDPGLPRVEYEIQVNGQVTSLSGAPAIIALDQTRAAVSRLPVAVRVPVPAQSLYAGQYADTVTFNFTAD